MKMTGKEIATVLGKVSANEVISDIVVKIGRESRPETIMAMSAIVTQYMGDVALASNGFDLKDEFVMSAQTNGHFAGIPLDKATLDDNVELSESSISLAWVAWSDIWTAFAWAVNYYRKTKGMYIKN